jgi:hypothetical protein
MKKLMLIYLTDRNGQPVELAGMDAFEQCLLDSGTVSLDKRYLPFSELASLKQKEYAFLMIQEEQREKILKAIKIELRHQLVLVGAAPEYGWIIDHEGWAGAIPGNGLKKTKRGFWMIGHVPVVSEVSKDVLMPRGNCQAFYFSEATTLLNYFDSMQLYAPHKAITVLKTPLEDDMAAPTSPRDSKNVATNTTAAQEAKASKTEEQTNSNEIAISSAEEDIEAIRKRTDAEAREKIKKHLFSDAFLQSRDWKAYHLTKDRKKLEVLFQKEIYFAYLKLRYPKASATEMSFWQDVKIIQRIGDKPGQADPKTVKTKELLTLEYDSQWKVLFTMDTLVTWKNGGRIMPEIVVFEKRTDKTTAADAEKRKLEWRKLFQEMSRSGNWLRIQYGQMELKNVMASYYGINQQILMGNTITDLANGWNDYLPISATESGKWFGEWMKKIAKL